MGLKSFYQPWVVASWSDCSHMWQKIIITHFYWNKKHLKNVGPIHHCEPPHAHSPDVASGTVVRCLRIDIHDDINNDDNAWQRGPLWPHGMDPITGTVGPVPIYIKGPIWSVVDRTWSQISVKICSDSILLWVKRITKVLRCGKS